MTETVYFMRHGDAGASGMWAGDDADRPLSKVGEERTLATARHLDAINFRPTRVLTSPLARALQTATIVTETLGMPESLEVDVRLSPGFGMEALAAILRDNAGVDRLMVVGHEPGFSIVIGQMIGGGSIVMKKGGIARVDLDGSGEPSGSLVWLVPPSVLVRSGA